MMRMPEITVEVHGAHRGLVAGRPCVSWSDRERRYHIWLKDDGAPQDDTIHSNPRVENPNKRWGRTEHRSLSLSAKRWAPMVSAIVDKIKADDLIAKAREAALAKQDAADAERIRAANEKTLARLDRAALHLPEALCDMIRSLPEAVRLEFVASLDRR